MKKHAIYLYLALIALVGCQNDSKKQALRTEIDQLKKEVGAAAQPSPEQLGKLMGSLTDYATQFPQDSLSVRYLAQAAESAKILQQYEKALGIYDQILANYPAHPTAAKALFMKAFMYENDLKNLDSAKVTYQSFMAKYPNDEFADEAAFLLENLGKSPEELIQQLEVKKGEQQ